VLIAQVIFLLDCEHTQSQMPLITLSMHRVIKK